MQITRPQRLAELQTQAAEPYPDCAVFDRARLWKLLDERLDDLRSIHAVFSRIPEIQ
jgi:hypothetical protein